jgi:hypothetical protein
MRLPCSPPSSALATVPFLPNLARPLPGLAALAFAAAAFAQSPNEAELELWRAAARIDTPAAYQAYLAAHPNGTFAAMARAAIEKLAPAAAAAPAAVPAGPSRLGPLSGGVTSGATELAVGARLTGPGVITVGSVGAKRQLVIPAGEWVLLAAEDHRTRGSAQFSLASLAFGQFDGSTLRSLLVASFNRRAIPVPAGNPSTYLVQGMLPTWTVAEQCERAGPGDALREVGGTPALRHCAAVRPGSDWRAALADTPLAEPVEQALKSLNAGTAPFAWRSELHYTDQRYGWLGIVRHDVAAVGPGAARAEAWRRYRALATRGYTRDLEADDLAPGAGRPAKPLELAD